MTRKEIAEFISENSTTGLNHAQAQEATNLAIEAIISAIEKGESVRLRGLGAFIVYPTRPRMARNVAVNEVVKVPASHRVKFKAGVNLRLAVRKL